jgi:hypothetical protein
VLDRIQSYFDGLAEIVPATAVQMSGAWSSKPQRRLVSSGGSQTREVIDWRWEGSFESEVHLAGLALLITKRDFYWVKARPPSPQPDVGVSAHGWANQADSVSFTGSFHGAVVPAVPVHIATEPPSACRLGDADVRLGVPHLVAALDDAAFAVVLVPKALIRVGRNRLWRLREGFESRLPPAVLRVLASGRSGTIEFPAQT